MSWLAYLALSFIHSLYAAYKVLSRCRWPFTGLPQSLLEQRWRLPSHLALVLVPDECSSVEARRALMIQNVDRVVNWCRKLGIRNLTVYDREGTLFDSTTELLDCLNPPGCSPYSSAESEPEYPLTPPLSDVSESRPLSPSITPPNLQLYTINIPARSPQSRRERKNVLKRRKPLSSSETLLDTRPLTIFLVSRMTGKPTVASLANRFLQLHDSSRKILPACPVDDLTMYLEGDFGLPPPDFMIVHSWASPRSCQPLELHGFPPWQMRLTEIYYSQAVVREPLEVSPSALLIDQHEFGRALDEFSSAEMRLGK